MPQLEQPVPEPPPLPPAGTLEELVPPGRLAELAAWLDTYPLLAAVIGLAVLLLVSWLVFVLVRGYLLRLLSNFVRKSPTFWDQVLLERQVFHRLIWGIPLLVIYQGVLLVPHLPEVLTIFIQRLVIACLVLIAIRAFSALLGGVNEIYNRYPMARHRPIKGYLQVLNVLGYVLAGVLMIAVLMDRDPLIFISGLGAMTAILLLIFRDTLLSLVAGVQLTTNDLIRVGDWIEMPQFDADGDVVDIALNSVMVQNWDRTFTVIPTHKFLEHSFKNWRGMQQSGGRRIKRSLSIDLTSIRFLTDEEVERFSRHSLLHDHFRDKGAELAEYNERMATSRDLVPPRRRFTNLGTLRAYISGYIRNHPQLHQEMIMMVRQLKPTGEGVPLEIYAFANDIRWVYYEGIQSDIFDHILAMVPEFGLRVYQQPAGSEMGDMARGLERIAGSVRGNGS